MLTLKASPGVLPSSLPEALRQVALQEDRSVCRCGASVPLGVKLGLRSRTRPVFEGRWTCNPRCLRKQVAAMMQRELQPRAERRAYQHRVPLGLMLHASGVVTHEDVRYALSVQEKTGQRIGTIFQKVLGIEERTIAQALAAQWGCGLSTEILISEETAACLAPPVVFERTGMVPVRMSRDGRIQVAFEERPDPLAVYALQRIHGTTVTAGVALGSVWKEGHARLGGADGVDLEEIECDDTAAMERQIVQILCRAQPVESRYVQINGLHWMRLWMEPAALAGGPSQRQDVQDVLFHIGKTRPMFGVS